MFAQYFEYYAIILGGGRFFMDTLYIIWFADTFSVVMHAKIACECHLT